MARQDAVKEAPVPPCLSGISMPIKPEENREVSRLGSYALAASMACTRAGGKCSRAKAAAASRTDASSSENTFKGGKVAAAPGEEKVLHKMWRRRKAQEVVQPAARAKGSMGG